MIETVEPSQNIISDTEKIEQVLSNVSLDETPPKEEEEIVENWEDFDEEKVPSLLSPNNSRWEDEDKQPVKGLDEKETLEKKEPAKKPTKASKFSEKVEARGTTVDNPLEDPAAEKQRKQKLVEEADFRNTQEMFSGLAVENIINTANPKDEKDFVELANSIAAKYSTFDKSFHYKNFLKTLFRQMAVNLKSDEIKDISSSLTILSNEKMKAEKEGTKKKKGAKKAQVNVKDDMNDDDYMDDYSDFM